MVNTSPTEKLTSLHNNVDNNDTHQLHSFVKQMRSELKGYQIYIPEDEGFEQVHQVYNADCLNRRPSVILRPETAEQVSDIVYHAVVERNLDISVRSGGHSYICQVQ